MNTTLSGWVRRLFGAGIGAVLLVLSAAACGTPAPNPAPAPSTAVPSTAAPATTAKVQPSPTAPAPTGAAAEPVLGTAWARTQRGYGTARPSVIDNGGDGSGVVTDVRWRSWGGPVAIADGTASDATGKASLAEAVQHPAIVQAFDLGMCQGKLMYRAIEWYFPSTGGKFDPNAYINICTGEYVGNH